MNISGKDYYLTDGCNWQMKRLLELKILSKKCYYIYEKDKIKIQEYNVDTHPYLGSLVASKGTDYRCNLSVHFPPESRHTMLLGQDESTFHEFTFSKKQWKTPTWYNFIQPKGDGEILMISGFQAR